MLEKVMVLVTVALGAYAQLAWKARALVHTPASRQDTWFYIAAMLRDPWIWTAVAATGLGMVSWMLVLRRLDLSVAYPAAALMFVLVPLGAHLVFGEQLSPLRITGLGLIVAGILVVARTA